MGVALTPLTGVSDNIDEAFRYTQEYCYKLENEWPLKYYDKNFKYIIFFLNIYKYGSNLI